MSDAGLMPAPEKVLTFEEQIALAGPEELEVMGEIIDAVIEQELAMNPLASYVPNGKIESLIKAIGRDGKEASHPHRYIYVLPAANGLGKTAAAINILGNIIYGPQSEWFSEMWRFEGWPFPKMFWYISEQTNLKDNVVGIEEGDVKQFQKWMPIGRYKLTKAGMDFFSNFTSDNGWSGTFKTYDMETKKFESTTVGVIIFDEPPPEQIFNAAVSRLRLGGIIIMPMTPLFTAAWVEERLVQKGLASDDSSVFVLEGDMEDACITHGKRGHLTHEYITRMIEEMDPDEVEARAHGKFMHLSGLIYKGLHPDVHHIKAETRIGKNGLPEIIPADRDPSYYTQGKFQIFNVVDPHDARPPFLCWFAVDRYDHAWLIEEFPQQPEFLPFHQIKSWKLRTLDVCKRIKAIEKNANWDPKKIIRIMDPNFGQKKDQAVGMTIAQYFAKCGRHSDIEWPLRYSTKVNDDIAMGHRIVQDFITPNVDGVVRFHVSPRCRNVWHQLTHYAWNPRSGKALDTHGAGEAVAQKYKDGSDLVRYFFMYFRGPKVLDVNSVARIPEHYAMYGYRQRPEEFDDFENINVYDPD